MARYIDADALYKETEKKIAEANSYRMAVVDGEFLDLINDAETEDVVPKSEVDGLIGKFECFLCHATGGRLSKHTYDLGTMESVATDCINETYNDGYGEGYKECAREIFEEIYEDCFDQFGYIDYEKLDELKKKYTEENK